MSTPTISAPQVAEITGKDAILVHAQNWMHKVFRELFATYGLPKFLVTDNGTAFKSAKFLGFLKSNSVHHVTTALFHSSSNGQAERAVQSTKEALKRRSTGSWSERLAGPLLSQHTTPHPKSNISPAELLTKRKLRTCLDQILLNNAKLAEREVTSPRREFKEDDHVFARCYNQMDKWSKAQIVKRLG
ncbi:Uncharacterized protein T10_6564 [Trichinella papuae]|uniref:Integrase catalytic domain-containing protein n=1 Tax=Trichinella papuae TaxID=268474 RepID=A0A0V1MFS9_9BILA|nr:Uncharacterized protein T10_6564 [Trichinella papuae]